MDKKSKEKAKKKEMWRREVSRCNEAAKMLRHPTLKRKKKMMKTILMDKENGKDKNENELDHQMEEDNQVQEELRDENYFEGEKNEEEEEELLGSLGEVVEATRRSLLRADWTHVVNDKKEWIDAVVRT